MRSHERFDFWRAVGNVALLYLKMAGIAVGYFISKEYVRPHRYKAILVTRWVAFYRLAASTGIVAGVAFICGSRDTGMVDWEQVAEVFIALIFPVLIGGSEGISANNGEIIRARAAAKATTPPTV